MSDWGWATRAFEGDLHKVKEVFWSQGRPLVGHCQIYNFVFYNMFPIQTLIGQIWFTKFCSYAKTSGHPKWHQDLFSNNLEMLGLECDAQVTKVTVPKLVRMFKWHSGDVEVMSWCPSDVRWHSMMSMCQVYLKHFRSTLRWCIGDKTFICNQFNQHLPVTSKWQSLLWLISSAFTGDV